MCGVVRNTITSSNVDVNDLAIDSGGSMSGGGRMAKGSDGSMSGRKKMRAPGAGWLWWDHDRGKGMARGSDGTMSGRKKMDLLENKK